MNARHTKKKLRAILILHNGNSKMRNLKINQMTWGYLAIKYYKWFRRFSMKDRVAANRVK